MVQTSIFIVEDDKSIQVLYEKVLTLVGFYIIGVSNNGQEAVEMFKEFNEKPDIVLMDYRMPVKNGIDASREILSISSKSKIIFTSADKTVKEEVIAMGIHGFLEKPFGINKLIDRIREIQSSCE
ncbi:MAG: response regulator [Promethearchaeota archaeon]